MTKKRKAYRPRTVLANPLAPKQPLSLQDRQTVTDSCRSALQVMVAGSWPSSREWEDLADVLNILETLVLAGQVAADGVMPTVKAGIVALGAAAARERAGTGLRLDGPGLQALRDAIDLFDQCMEAMSAHEIAVARQLTQDRVRALLRSKKPNHQVVTL